MTTISSWPMSAADHCDQLTPWRTRLGDRSFSAAGPRFCNCLPAALPNDSISLPLFKIHLKTLLFEWCCDALSLLLLCTVYKYSYLLTYLLSYLLVYLSNGSQDGRSAVESSKVNVQIPRHLRILGVGVGHFHFWCFPGQPRNISISAPDTTWT